MLPDLEELEENYKCIEENIVDTSRWHIVYENIYTNEDKSVFYRASFRRGATEYQDDGPEDVYITEVVPTEKTITVYVDKK